MKTKFNGILTLLLAFTVHFAFAQKTVSGTVSDESGPLPGVSVLIKGTTTGTETDFDGNYTMQANSGETLQFSYIGMETAYKTIGAASTYNVVLVADAANILDEVVVTGVAGATSRSKLSVTVNKVSSKELEVVPTTSAESVLQGKVAGVSITNFGQPGKGASIQLRGATNFYGSQAPMVIVDGVIVDQGLQDINSNDIKSIEIVKGASASALYGSRAGNGVIVVTTKKGRKGEVDVTIKSDVGFTKINNFVETNNSHHFDLASDWESHKGTYTKYDGVTYPDNYDGVDYSSVAGARVVSADHYSDSPFGVNFNPQEQFFRTGTSQNLYASVATGGEKSKLFFSAEKTNSEGILKETKGYERIAARVNTEFNITDWLTLTANNNIIRTFDNSPGGGGGIFFNLLVVQPDVNLLADNQNGQPYILTPSNWYTTSTNPMYPLWANQELRQSNKFLGAYKLNFKFTDWLNFDVDYAIEAYDSDYSDFTSNITLSNHPTNVATLFTSPYAGDFRLSKTKNTSQKGQFTLNFKKDFNELTVTSKVSYLLEDIDYDYFYGRGYDQLYADVISLDNYKDTFTGSDDENINARNFFGIVGFDLKDRYILDAMYRIDGASTFGENERWNDYYRVSGAYRISKDLNIDNINEMKFHVAYGTSGQRPGYDWQYHKKFLSNGSLSGATIKGNPDLKPSKTTELEFGFSTKIFNKINFEAVYSKAQTDDQFMLVDLFPPLSGGDDKQWQNIGSLEFNTIEMSLGASIFDKEDFKWDSNIVFDTTTSLVTKLNTSPQTVGPGADQTLDGQIFRIEEDVEFGTMWGYQFVSTLDQMSKQLPEGSTIDEYVVNKDGVVVLANTIGTELEKTTRLVNEDGSDNLGEIGNANADFKIGFRNNLSYKNFGLYFLFDWKQGGDIYNRNAQWLTRDYRHKMLDMSNVEASEKKTTDYYQSLYDTNADNKFWVEDGSYVKLREASLFYTINKDNLSGIANGFFDSIKIGLTGTNLLTFTNYSGWDPEVQLYDGNTMQYFSVDQNSYPISSSYKLSFTVKF